jgi:Uma2 family endonuclease
MSTSVATQSQYTPEDLLAMPDGKSYELVGGQLVERKMGMESSLVGTRLLPRLSRFCEEHGLGWTFQSDNGYQCFAHEPGLVRRPDVSFIRNGRLADNVVPLGWAKMPPDLAVEVVSPNDIVYQLDDKLEDYRKAGVPLIWVIYPNSRTVMIYRVDGSTSLLHENDVLSEEDIIPGFRCSVREIFPSREASPEVAPNPTAPNGAR